MEKYINENSEEFFDYLTKARNDKNFVKSYNQERIKRVEDILLSRKDEFKEFSFKDAEFILSELDWLRNCCYITEEEYLQITRHGRGNKPQLNLN